MGTGGGCEEGRCWKGFEGCKDMRDVAVEGKGFTKAGCKGLDVSAVRRRGVGCLGEWSP